MANTALCCCFSNNVRHLVLCLFIACATILFTNLTLFSVLVTIKTDVPFSYLSYEYGFYDVPKPSRKPRDLSNETENEITEFYGHISSSSTDNFSTELTANSNLWEKSTRSLEVEGYPVVSDEEQASSTEQIATTVTVTISTTPKTVFITGPVASSDLISSSEGVASSDLISSSEGVAPTYIPVSKDSTKDVLAVDDKDVSKGATKKSFDDSKSSYSSEELLTKSKEKANEFGSSASVGITPLLVWVAPGFGIFFGTFLSMWLMKPLGIRKLFPIALVVCSFATLTLGLIFFYRCNIMVVTAFRFVQALPCGTVLPVLGSMTASWGTLKEQYFFIVFGHLFVQLIPLVSWPFSLWLFELEFSLPFIVHATIAMVSAIIWVLFYRDRPQYHPWVNGLELNKIVTGKIKAISNRSLKKDAIGMAITSLPVWAVWFSAFSYFVVIALILQYLPIYCCCVLQIKNPIWEIAVAFLLMLIMTLLYPLWIHITRKIGEKMSVKLFNLFSFATIGVAFIFIALSPKNSVLSRGAFVLVLLALVLSFYGFYRSAILIGRYYAQHIISYAQITLAVAFIFVSILVYFLDNPWSSNEWHFIFVIISLVQFISAAVFYILGSWKPEEWSKQTWNPSVGRPLVSVDQIDLHNEECGFIEMNVI